AAYDQGPWGPQGLDAYAFGFSPDGGHVFYKQQNQAGYSFISGPTYAVELDLVDVSGAAPAPAGKGSPTGAGIPRGGAVAGSSFGSVRFGGAGAKVVMTFLTSVAGNVIEVYVRDIALGSTANVGTSTAARLNNNATGPKWSPSGRGLVLTGP